MGIEVSAFIHFGWAVMLFDDNDTGFIDGVAYDDEYKLKPGYIYGNDNPVLPHLRIKQRYVHDDREALIAHKDIQIVVRSLEIAPIRYPDHEKIKKMTSDLKADVAALGMPIEYFGEPQLLLTCAELWQGEYRDEDEPVIKEN